MAGLQERQGVHQPAARPGRHRRHEAADPDRRGHRARTPERPPAAGRLADALVRGGITMDRRQAVRALSVGGASLFAARDAVSAALAPQAASASTPASKGTAPVKIRDIKTILTAPNGIRLVVVKIETTEAGLVGWGCATFTQRALVVQTALEYYLKPFLIGRNVDEIEDIWQSSYVSSYWRNGPVLFNAMSGVDIALWDIKAKRAGMPLYQLLGGKVRHGADCYFHASGTSLSAVEDSARRAMEQGFRHVRVQVATPGYAGYGARATAPASGSGAPE